ncbi:hypothetical protein KC207_05975 [Phycicoccus sp. BSK3Z-2]|uniref:Uncharacterized protein n=1 Tax=Phycicoccus avicenniae TaxID=2828860 RepID=A0A941D664_9MICO|nr:hypothetical protein [Phycicoccus avicenniae]MBR7742839.1 hypothetical protein [Phycicoccus avicenniae]
MATTYRLRAGDTGPVQQSPVTCGSACLTVARMLVDPVFASWVRTGRPRPPGSPPGETEAERFAAYERVVMRRTNGVRRGGPRVGPPWPRSLGTPPWGARAELERGASTIGTRYRVDVVRGLDEYRLVEAFDALVRVVAHGQPALLYVGNGLLPRHVVLVLPGDGDRMLDVYDPATGRVDHLRRDVVVHHRLRLSGWDVPWMVVRPTGHRTARAHERARSPRPAPA